MLHWIDLINGVRAHDDAALTELYSVLKRGFARWLFREYGPTEMEDRLHDLWIALVRAIERNRIEDPERLMGYARSIARHELCQAIPGKMALVFCNFQHCYAPDPAANPEHAAEDAEMREMVFGAMKGLDSDEREILIRFYVEEQPADEIRVAMGLTETTFRLRKCRAKIKFGKLGRHALRSPFGKRLDPHRAGPAVRVA